MPKPRRAGKTLDVKKQVTSAILVGLGWLSLAVGFVGIFLPVLPTVPFVILAALCFSKGSPKLHQWLRRHPRFGGSLVLWEDHGVIRKRGKWMASICMVLGLVYPVFFGKLPLVVKIGLVVTILCTMVFIWTRPSVWNRK